MLLPFGFVSNAALSVDVQVSVESLPPLLLGIYSEVGRLFLSRQNTRFRIYCNMSFLRVVPGSYTIL